MKRALEDITLKKCSVRRAAEEYGIPKSTIYDRLSGKVIPGSVCGAQRYLMESEENAFLLGCAQIGYGKTRSEVLLIVQKTLKERGIIRQVSNGWWEGFLRRHPKLTLRTPACLAKARAHATDDKVMDQYFSILDEALTENELKDKPLQVFNIDETGVPLDPKPLKVVSHRGDKNPSSVRSGKKEQITVVACTNAGGGYLPPMIIWNTETLSPGQTLSEVPGTLHAFSSKGWMDQELFYFWFTKHFLRYVPSTRPLLLLLDGHSSHYCPSTIHFAAKEKVIIFTLSPNTTHLTQPLDKGVFGPLNKHWQAECQKFINFCNPSDYYYTSTQKLYL